MNIKKHISNWYKTTGKNFYQKTQRGEFVDLNEWAFNNQNNYIASFSNVSVDDEFKLISQQIQLENKIEMSIREMWNIWNWVKKTSKLGGQIAEVGSYKGGSAKIICKADSSRIFHIFDTFEGLPEVTIGEDGTMQKGDMACSLESVQEYLKEFTNIKYHKGFFGIETFPAGQFSFVNIDVDTYESTKKALELFYPLMKKGGVIIDHDYRSLHCPGAKKAIDEVMANKPEPIIELWDNQCLIIKQ